MRTRFKASHIGLFLLLATTWLIYRPGLAGPFLFDDYANLPALGAGGPVNNTAAFVRYVTSGTADPTGRPVALASFLADAQDWPADPYPFKRSNLILHLLNGALLFSLLLRLGVSRSSNDERTTQRAGLAALLATGCWLLHPLFVSTTLYVVQREAMLPVTFVLLGLLGWMAGRDRIAKDQIRTGLVYASTSLIAATGLGLLSKANGVLLPAFALIIEWALLRHTQPIHLPRAARANAALLAGCGVVSAAITAGLVWLGVRGIVHGIGDQRPWTLGERLLTEPRILWDYLRLIWLPHSYTAGVFNDQFVTSTNLFKPWTTLPALLGMSGLIAGGIVLRHRVPALSAAILFFLIGHSLESTSIPLELYFEHRNYLPSLLMFWPLAQWLTQPEARIGTVLLSAGLRIAMSIVMLSGLALMTLANASLWGNGHDQARLWAALNPQSPRAQVNAAQNDIERGDPASAIARLAPLLQAHPDQVQLALNLLAARCAMHSLTDNDVVNARVAMATARDSGTLLVSWFGRAIASAHEDSCTGLDLTVLESMVDAGTGNPYLPDGRRQDLEHIRGVIALERRDPAKAMAAFDRALTIEPRIEIALQQAAALGSAGYPAEGLRHLKVFDTLSSTSEPGAGMPMIHSWILKKQDYWPRERKQLENTLRNDLQQSARRQ